MGFPRTLIEFQDRFPDEESCWAFLRRERWPRGFVCPRCGGSGSHFIETRRLEQCRSCRYQASVTAGTVFHKTRKPLRIWFLAIFFLARHKKGISALQFQKDAGIGSYQTAWTLLHKLRSALGRRTGEVLSGLVEADAAYVGGPRSGVRGRGAANKSIVAVAVERRAHTAGSLRLDVSAQSEQRVTGRVHDAQCVQGRRNLPAAFPGHRGRQRGQVHEKRSQRGRETDELVVMKSCFQVHGRARKIPGNLPLPQAPSR
jgi:hypothetical protein